METIEIYEEAIQIGAGHSSKGDQLKWVQDGWWYKADRFGYEGLAETVASRLLEHSTVREFVCYEPVRIRYKGNEYRGCRSRNFRGEKEELVPLERLSRIYTGRGLAQKLAEIPEISERIQYTEELVHSVTGLTEFGSYLTKMLEMDAFFLNEDRHTNNIAVLYDTETKDYRLCPFYDMGLSLFSDTKADYPPGKSFSWCREKIQAKPFSVDFDEQMDAANELYGSFLKFDFPARAIVRIALPELLQQRQALQQQRQTSQQPWQTEEERRPSDMDFPDIYMPEEKKRVEEVLRYQAGKYQYLFTRSNAAQVQ